MSIAVGYNRVVVQRHRSDTNSFSERFRCSTAPGLSDGNSCIFMNGKKRQECVSNRM